MSAASTTTEYANAVSNENFRMCRIVRITRAGLGDSNADVETILDHMGREEDGQGV